MGKRFVQNLWLMVVLIIVVVVGSFLILQLMEANSLVQQVEPQKGGDVIVDVYTYGVCARIKGELRAYECVNWPEDGKLIYSVYHRDTGKFIGKITASDPHNVQTSTIP